MKDVLRDSIVNYHNQQFGESLESFLVNDVSQEIDELVMCQNQDWCPLKDHLDTQSGTFLEFDLKDLDTNSVEIDVFKDILCIKARTCSKKIGYQNQTALDGREFGLHQCIHLPKETHTSAVTAHIDDNNMLKVWVPYKQAI